MTDPERSSGQTPHHGAVPYDPSAQPSGQQPSAPDVQPTVEYTKPFGHQPSASDAQPTERYSQPFGHQPTAPYTQQPPSPYGQQPAAAYGQQPPAPYAQPPAAPYGQQPSAAYGQQQYGQAMYPAPPRGLSVASMVIGIVSLVFLWFTIVVPLIGFVLGVMGLKREPAARGFALAGIWLNGVILALTVLGILIFFGVFLAFGAASLPFFLDPSTYVDA